MSNQLHFITGGSRSGKSSYSLQLAKSHPQKVFIATAEPFDGEMNSRIQMHRDERGGEYQTLEEPINLGRALLEAVEVADVVVIDCLTVWVGNLMHHFEDDYPNFPQIDEFLNVLMKIKGRVLIVSNELGMGLVPPTPMGRRYRDLAGSLNQKVASICSCATLVVSGIPIILKGDK